MSGKLAARHRKVLRPALLMLIGRTYFLEDIQRVTDPLKGYDLYTAQAE